MQPRADAPTSTKNMLRPSEELIRIGKDYRLRKNKPDSALLFFTIVAGRYTPNMSAEEKREVLEALNMNYFIYSFTYLNYPKAYENLLRAHTISKELGETSAALYFNLGSMYQLVAGHRDDSGNSTVRPWTATGRVCVWPWRRRICPPPTWLSPT